jgi:predicted O-methyltransferase YrrM
MRVLEFGSGGSTMWLAQRTAEVVSIENSSEWAEEIARRLPANARVIIAPRPESLAPQDLNDLGRFHVLVVDADADRIACARQALPLLNETGVVIWDNTDGPDWHAIKALLVDSGFREISFLGMVPQEVMLRRTTVFYRDSNCLDI